MTTFKVGDRVKHIYERMSGTISSIGEEPEVASVRWDNAGGVYKHPIKNLYLEDSQPAKEPTMTKTIITTWKFTYNEVEVEVEFDTEYPNEFKLWLRGEDNEPNYYVELPIAELSAILKEIEGGK